MKKVPTCLEEEAPGVGRRASWEETGQIRDPIYGWSAFVIPEEIRSGFR